MATLPSGTVTFLFTDIEGSTERWERDPKAMAAAVNRHLAILGNVIEAHGGVHFKTVGDAMQAAFPTAPQALAAALDGQRALRAEDWGEIGGLSVRMALHTGQAAPDEWGDYLAAPLNRLSRLMSAGHGGQILLSQAVQQLTREALPAGSSLRDLGEHRLRDLIEPERVYLLQHPDLPDVFAPLRTLASRAHNFPRQPNPFFGREREVGEIVALLRREDVQILTLTGPGGTGKTRLAMQAAGELVEDYPDGVYLVELAPLSEANLVPTAIATALQLHNLGEQSPLEAVIAFLRGRRALLVLDNFEHLLDAAPVVGEILASCPHVEVLATSRAPLRVRAERPYPVPPLGLSRSGGQEASEAVAFFIERATAANPGFTPDPEAMPIIAEIVRRLDGLPLAIELAAARARLLPPAALLARLEQRLPLLTGGARDAPARQRTLRAAIAWSHDLLTEEERALFRRLASFVGGFTFDAAEAVANPDGDLDILFGVESLADHSLLRQGGMPDGTPRFTMLETVSEYALELLAASGEEDAVRQRHAEYFLALAETANDYRFSEQEGAWHDRLIIEYPNLRAAMHWLHDTHDDQCLMLLAGALAGLWLVRAQHREGTKWLDLALAGDASASARLRCLHRATLLAEARGDMRRATELAEEALELAQRAGKEKELADAQRCLGQMLLVQGDLQRAPDLLTTALSWHRSAGDAFGAADVLLSLAEAAARQGDHDLARSYIQESIEFSRQVADERGVASALFQLAFLHYAEGDGDRAIALLEDALQRWQRVQTTSMVAVTQMVLAILLADHQGDDARAETLLSEALDFWREAGNNDNQAEIQSALGDIAIRRGEFALAEERLREALALGQAAPDPIARVSRTASALAGLGRLAVARGELTRAAAYLGDALERLREIPLEDWKSRSSEDDGLYGLAAACLRHIANVVAAEEETEQAARLLGAAATLQAAANFPLLRAERARVDQDASAIRDRTSEEAFASARGAGAALSIPEAINEGLRLAGAASRS